MVYWVASYSVRTAWSVLSALQCTRYGHRSYNSPTAPSEVNCLPTSPLLSRGLSVSVSFSTLPPVSTDHICQTAEFNVEQAAAGTALHSSFFSTLARAI